jgi:ectoine hydroxylase-related dioxygenase (phytanoyl-CoA dioxygenase family)
MGNEVSLPQDGELKVSCSAGSAVVFSSNLWHTSTRHVSGGPRRGLFAYFGHYWIKRMDEFYEQPLPSLIERSQDPLVRQLFGGGGWLAARSFL